MPNAKVLSEKQAIVEELTKRLQAASAGVLVDYKGITVLEDTKLRRDLRTSEIDYTVVKNTLLRFAVEKTELKEMESVLSGTTSLATTTGDPIAPIRILSDYAKKMGDRFELKLGFMEGRVLTQEELAEIAELPSKEALYAKVLGTMLAPITSLAVVLGQIVAQGGGDVAETAEAPAEASAEPVAEEAAAETPVETAEEPAIEAAVETSEAPPAEPAAEPAAE